MHLIEPAARQVPYMVVVGNHEYCYDNKHHEDADPSGASEPFQPDWGNYGNDSGGECGVPFAKRFQMPSNGVEVPSNKRPEIVNGSVDGHANVLDENEGWEDDWGEDEGGEDVSPANRKPPRDNAPFWYAFDYGSVHFVAISTEHDLGRKSRQHRYVWMVMLNVILCVRYLSLSLYIYMYICISRGVLMCCWGVCTTCEYAL